VNDYFLRGMTDYSHFWKKKTPKRYCILKKSVYCTAF